MSGNKLRIYVAGASAEMPRVKKFYGELRMMGHVVSFDWVRQIEEVEGGASPDDAELRALCAARDLRAVRDSDLVVLLSPVQPASSTGAWVELGAAVTAGVPVFVSALHEADRKKCIFQELAARVFEGEGADEAVLECLRKVAPNTWVDGHYPDLHCVTFGAREDGYADFFLREPFLFERATVYEAETSTSGPEYNHSYLSASKKLSREIAVLEVLSLMRSGRKLERGAMVLAGTGVRVELRNIMSKEATGVVVLEGKRLRQESRVGAWEP